MRILAALFALALITGPALAAPWKLDKSHTAVTFSVEHLGFSTTQGWFRKFDAEIDFDPDSIETSSVKFEIDAASVDTNWKARDRHVRSKDFLDVENHPTIRFESTKIRLTGTETATATGDFTMRGETHEETFNIELKRIGPSPFNPSQTIAGFVVTGTIDRGKYGVKFGIPAIGGKVPIRVDMEISPE